jgi:hypothetical protein
MWLHFLSAGEQEFLTGRREVIVMFANESKDFCG